MRLPHLTIRQKLVCGIGLPIVLLAGLGVSAALQGRRVQRAIRQVTEVHEPINRAILQMEGNLSELSVALLGYLHDHDPKHLERLAVGGQEFQQFHARYGILTAAAAPDPSSAQLAEEYRELLDLAHVLAALEDREQAKLDAVQARFDQLNTLLDQQIWRLTTAQDGAPPAGAGVPFLLEVRAGRLAKSFARALRTHEAADEGSMRGEAAQFHRALEKLEPAPEELRAVFTALTKEIDDILTMERTKVEGLARFVRQRRALDAWLDARVQAPAERTLGDMTRQVLAAASRMELLILVVLGLSLALGIATGLIAWRSITAPMSRLMAVMHAIAKGDLTQRTRITTKDEFGALGSTFDHMAATLQTLERELREAARLKGEFSAAVSHELRSPLASIKQTLDIVEDGTCGPLNDEQREYLQIAKQSVDRLRLLITDLLDFQKLEAGRMPIHLAPQDLNTLTRQTAQGFALVARQRGVELVSRPADGLPPVACDKDRIAQVLTNLINNAIKFTERGTIVVSTARENGLVRCAVQDSGIGIAPADQAKLFQRFSQVGGHQEGGTGLGLAICKQIVELHGGTIGVESAPGAGSTFYFTLPVK